jgi:hypothetical protein
MALRTKERETDLHNKYIYHRTNQAEKLKARAPLSIFNIRRLRFGKQVVPKQA